MICARQVPTSAHILASHEVVLMQMNLWREAGTEWFAKDNWFICQVQMHSAESARVSTEIRFYRLNRYAIRHKTTLAAIKNETLSFPAKIYPLV